LVPDIYLQLLEHIAQSKEIRLQMGEKIEIDVRLLNELTQKSRYSYERELSRQNRQSAIGYFKDKNQK